MIIMYRIPSKWIILLIIFSLSGCQERIAPSREISHDLEGEWTLIQFKQVRINGEIITPFSESNTGVLYTFSNNSLTVEGNAQQSFETPIELSRNRIVHIETGEEQEYYFEDGMLIIKQYMKTEHDDEFYNYFYLKRSI